MMKIKNFKNHQLCVAYITLCPLLVLSACDGITESNLNQRMDQTKQYAQQQNQSDTQQQAYQPTVSQIKEIQEIQRESPFHKKAQNTEMTSIIKNSTQSLQERAYQEEKQASDEQAPQKIDALIPISSKEKQLVLPIFELNQDLISPQLNSTALQERSILEISHSNPYAFIAQLPQDSTIQPHVEALYQGELYGVYPLGLKEFILVTPQALYLQLADLSLHPIRWEMGPLDLPNDINRMPSNPQKIIGSGRLTLNASENVPWIAYEDGLWIFNPQRLTWLPSPLNDEFEGLSSIVWTKGAIWWIDQRGLGRWYQNQAQRFDLPVSSHDQLYARKIIVSHDNTLPANPGNHYDLWLFQDQSLMAFSGLTIYQHPTWVAQKETILSNDGIWHLNQFKDIVGGPDGSPWRMQNVGIPFDQLWAHPNQLIVWGLSQQRLWAIQDLRAVSIDFEGIWRGGFCDEAGLLYLWGSQGLLSLSLTKRIRVDAPNPNIPIGPQINQITINPDQPDQLNRLQVIFDPQTPLEQIQDIELNAAIFPLTLPIQPLRFTPGLHDFQVIATYQDQTFLQANGRFQIAQPIRWYSEIQPLFIEKCERCHGERGGARRLETADFWRNEYPEILRAVIDQRMPIGVSPLNATEISLIEAWSAWGYLE